MMSKENQESVIAKAKELIKSHSIENLNVLEVHEVNFKPHMPVIGLKAMRLNSLVIGEDAPCSYEGCNLKLNEHHGDIVLFLELIGIVSKEPAEAMLFELNPTLEEFKIDGLSFVQKDKTCVFSKNQENKGGDI